MTSIIRVNEGCLSFPENSITVQAIMQQTGGSGVVTFTERQPCLPAGEFLVTGLGSSVIPPITSLLSILPSNQLMLHNVLPARLFKPEHVSLDSIVRISGNGGSCSLGLATVYDTITRYSLCTF
jgi:hypothetical protein